MAGHLLSPPSLASTQDLLIAPGRCFYIPPYQRHFGWSGKDIERYYEGIVSGIRSMADSQQRGSEASMAETFMGTIVCFEEKSPYNSISPKVANDLPEKVLVLIDGQQRLTVSLVTAMVLHDFLCTSKLSTESDFFKTTDDQLKQGDTSDKQREFAGQLKQIRDLKMQTQSMLFRMFYSLAVEGDSNCNPYPRMIRGLEDRWSKTASESINASPICCLLADYIDHFNKHKGDIQFDFKTGGDKCKASTNDLTIMLERAAEVVKYVNRLAKIKQNTYNRDTNSFGSLPSMSKVFESEEMQETLFDRTGKINLFSPNGWEVNDGQLAKQDKTKKLISSYEQVAQVITFATYFLTRVKFIHMVTISENSAISIFDSLNTTGDPLTAFETFKPEVIKAFYDSDVPIEEYKKSKHRVMIDEIDAYLEVRKNDQAKKTRELIISFALAETAKKLGTSLNEQRQYMYVQYKQQRDKNKELRGEAFVSNFRYVARVYESFAKARPAKGKPKARNRFKECLSGKDEDGNLIWSTDDPTHRQLAGEASFCLKFLVAAGHKIIIPLISRFYAKYCESRLADDHKSLCKAIRATAAFFTLWRISMKGDLTIDVPHRNIMHHSDPNSPPKLNYARAISNPKEPDIKQLTKEYYRLLVDEIGLIDKEKELQTTSTRHNLSKEAWIILSNDMPIYSRQKEAAKFILMLSAYGLTSDSPISAGIFSEELWDHPAHNSIEHIIPQSTPDAKGTEDKEKIDSIGNLTLLPLAINSYIKNADWKRCKQIYAALTANSDELNVKINELGTLSEKDEEQLRAARKTIKVAIEDIYNGAYLPTIESITKYDEFGLDQIPDRGKEILDSSWNLLIKWLGSDF